MSRKCELTGVNAQFGNNVSHSQRKTRRSFDPNIRIAHYISEATGQRYRVKIAAKTMRSIEKVGGFDAFMLKLKAENMSTRMRTVKKLISKKKIEAAA